MRGVASDVSTAASYPHLHRDDPVFDEDSRLQRVAEFGQEVVQDGKTLVPVSHVDSADIETADDIETIALPTLR